MSEHQKPPKPGFFSRLFTAHDIEAPPDDAAPPGLPLPAEEEPPAGDEALSPEEQHRGLFSRWFGGASKEAPAEGAEGEAPAEGVRRPGWFERLRTRLRRGSGSFMASIRSAVGMSGRLDEDTIEQIEEILVAADVGMDTTMKIIDRMKKRARAESIEGADAVMKLLRETLEEVFSGNVSSFRPASPKGPYVVMVTGVNGTGKTTTIGKIAKRCRDAGLSTMLVAGDTFRAAAIEQLEIWAQRTGSEFMKSRQGADPSGLLYDALQTAKSRGIDVVLIDTAGRLHTRTSLMEELGKLNRVAAKILPGAPHETLLVLDATTGQNAVQQVKTFSGAVPITGLVMTKLDGTAKGGVLITLRDRFSIPITLIGVGEGVDDLRDFDPEQFVAALFDEEPERQTA